MPSAEPPKKKKPLTTAAFASCRPERESGPTNADQPLELVPQSKLHHAWRGKQSAISSERGSGVEGVRNGRNIKALQVRNVEYLPAKHQIVRFGIGHHPTFAEAHIQTGEARA